MNTMALTAHQEPSNLSVITPMTMLQTAIEKGASLEQVERLMDLQDRFEKNEARKAFTVALSAFKSEGLTIDKDKHVSFKTNTGKTEYNHATLGNVCNTIGAELSKHGLSFRWATEQADGKIKVTCVLMHVMGHSESVSLESTADSSGGKNSIQAIGSAVSYLQRYTLLAITGTATQEQDDDSRGFGVCDVMDEWQLCDFIAAIHTANTQGEILKAYLPAIEIAAGIGDKAATVRLSAAKMERIEKLKGEKK